MSKDNISVEVKLNLLKVYGLNQLFKKSTK
jgi:hypothetical protein